MGGMEGLGEAVTGSMVGRAVEPRSGEGTGTEPPDSTCLNCGTGLIGDYCHRCGQSGHVRRTLRAFGHDVAHSVLHFEGKIWRTLPLLAWRPGELTRRYVAGERARFVSPMALFLFSVFLMFAVFSLLGGPIDFASDTPQQDRAEAARDFDREQAQSRAELRELETQLAQAKAKGEPTAGLEGEITGVKAEMAAQERVYRIAMRLAAQEEARAAEQSKTEQDAAAKEPESESGQINIIDKTGWEPLDRAVEKAEKNPSLLLYKIQNNAYKFSWALIPISVPFLAVLFLHRRRYWKYKLYDHTVFVTYSIAFMSLGLIGLTLLRPLGLGEGAIWLAIMIVPPIHMFRQLRGAYSLSRWSALWRTFFLLFFASTAASLFLVLLLTVGVLG